jgi:hypothetical protein
LIPNKYFTVEEEKGGEKVRTNIIRLQPITNEYVELLYNPRTRIMNCSAIIPLADYFKMDLNDIVQFRGNHYHLRAINNYNLSNGECDLELLGPILGDVLANILPGVQCQFDFDIEDVYYGWRIITCDETPVTYEVTFNTTSSIVPGMIISASSEISGCWTISGSVTQSSMDYYDVGIYGTYTTCASCSAAPPPPPTSSFYVSQCDDTAQLTFDFTSSLSMSIGDVFTLPSAYALEGCWYVSSSYSGATDLSDVIISQSFVDCETCETPPPEYSYLVLNCENTSSTYYVTFFDDIIPSNVFTSTTGSLSGSCWSVSGSASVAPDISEVGGYTNYANCSICLGEPVEYQIDNGASGDSSSACSSATTTSIVYADPGYTVPFVGMILYDSSALTTPFIGSAGWRKLTGPLDIYAVEIDTDGEITNYVTCP